ncbi:unnamed protein product [Caenorhabditis brenneri]
MDADISPPVKRKRVEEDNGNDDEFEQFLALLERKKQEEAAPEESLGRMSFEETEADEVVLVVHGKKFEVSRRMLTEHSPYFMNKFYGDEAEPDRDEIVLINPSSADEFKLFLGTLRRDGYINGENIRDVLDISMQCSAKAAVNQCIKFLKSASRMSTKKRFDIALRYNLEEFKKELISKCISPDEINRILPADLTTLDHATMGLLFEKNLELQGFPGRYPPRQEDGDRSSFTESDTSEESVDDDDDEEW